MVGVAGTGEAIQTTGATVSSHAKPLTRGVRGLLFFIGFLVLGVGLDLYLFSDLTDRRFAWTINPPLTAAFLGAAYLAGFVLTFASARQSLWARARIAVPAILTFTVLTLIATLIHIDRFHLGSQFEAIPQTIAWLWLIIYAVAPPVMFVILVLQLRTPGGDPPREVPIRPWARGVLAVQGGLMLVLGIGLFLVPETFAPLWPWPLTPLTGRAVGAWLIGFGIATLHADWENDWKRAQAAALACIALGVLELVALLRFPGTLDWAGVDSWVYVLFLLSVLAVGVYGFWNASRAKTTRPITLAG
jgi:hypothetical protein